MNNKALWTFRVFFLLSVIYHLWSLIQSGFDAFRIIELGSVILTILASLLNYLIQIGLPILFLYFSFPKREKTYTLRVPDKPIIKPNTVKSDTVKLNESSHIESHLR